MPISFSSPHPWTGAWWGSLEIFGAYSTDDLVYTSWALWKQRSQDKPNCRETGFSTQNWAAIMLKATRWPKGAGSGLYFPVDTDWVSKTQLLGRDQCDDPPDWYWRSDSLASPPKSAEKEKKVILHWAILIFLGQNLGFDFVYWSFFLPACYYLIYCCEPRGAGA